MASVSVMIWISPDGWSPQVHFQLNHRPGRKQSLRCNCRTSSALQDSQVWRAPETGRAICLFLLQALSKSIGNLHLDHRRMLSSEWILSGFFNRLFPELSRCRCGCDGRSGQGGPADHTSMTAANDLAVRHALEAAGVEFIDENGGGAGVRL